MSILTGRAIFARPIQAADAELAYSIEVTDVESLSWRFGPRVPSFGEYSSSMWGDVLTQFLTCGKRNGRPIGLTTIYNADHRNGHAYVAVVSRPEYRRSGLALAGAMLVVTHCFRTWPFRRLYAEATSETLAQYGSILQSDFVREVLRLPSYGHSPSGDSKSDRVILMLEREQWMAGPGSLVTREWLRS